MENFRAWYQVNAAVLWLETVVALVILLGLVVFLWTRLQKLQDRYRRLMGDSTSDRLEEMLEDHVRRVGGTLDRVDALERLGEGKALALALQTVGRVHTSQARWDETLADLTRALDLLAPLEDRALTGRLWIDVGEVYWRQGEWGQARER